MSYLGKYDVRFITFVNKKYNKKFRTYDDYTEYLFYQESKEDVETYELQKEEDLRGFCEWQEEQMKKW